MPLKPAEPVKIGALQDGIKDKLANMVICTEEPFTKTFVTLTSAENVALEPERAK
jgi:hypothetical protein